MIRPEADPRIIAIRWFVEWYRGRTGIKVSPGRKAELSCEMHGEFRNLLFGQLASTPYGNGGWLELLDTSGGVYTPIVNGVLVEIDAYIGSSGVDVMGDGPPCGLMSCLREARDAVALPVRRSVQAIVPAAGQGRRMQAAFPDLPKVLIPVRGKPMLRWVVESLRDVDAVEETSVVVSPDGATQVQRSLSDYALRFVVQERPLGTGHAVSVALEGMADSVGAVLILYGDQPLIRAATLGDLIRHHQNEGAVLTFLTVQVESAPPHLRGLFADWSRVVRDGAGRPVRSVEARDATVAERDIREVNPSIYCAEAGWLRKELRELKPANVQGEYYLTDIVEAAARGGVAVRTVTASDPRETLGANTVEQLGLLDEVAGGMGR